MCIEMKLFLLIGVIILIKINTIESQKPRLGGAVNIFSRYGYLSISMRVVPRNDTDDWIFREPTLDVFNNNIESIPMVKSTSVFDGDFHMEFCDNLRQLLQAYFRDFTFERLETPWHAFTASWTKALIAKHLGINTSYINQNYRYVLIRVARYRDNQKLSITSDDLILDDIVSSEADNLTIGDTASVIKFVRNFGSHYISSFITGNSLYQVFVYSPQVYNRIKERLKTRGVSEISHLELSNFFSPWWAEHIGNIQSASGNRSVEAWAEENLRDKYYYIFPTLLKLHIDSGLLRQLNSLLGNEALLQLKLHTLAPVFKDSERRKWFLQVIDNYFRLWEVNM